MTAWRVLALPLPTSLSAGQDTQGKKPQGNRHRCNRGLCAVQRQSAVQEACALCGRGYAYVHGPGGCTVHSVQGTFSEGSMYIYYVKG
jgi:hypothetical protein